MNFLGYCPYKYPKTWGEKLRLYRIFKGLTYKELARILKVDQRSLIKWEKGINPPNKFYQNKVTWFMQ